jgi:hypothetical protein
LESLLRPSTSRRRDRSRADAGAVSHPGGAGGLNPMTSVYSIGDVPITFDRVLTAGDDPINFVIVVAAPPAVARHPTIDAADVATLEAYAASRAPMPWSGPAYSAELIKRYPDDHQVFRQIPWPEEQRRIVDRFVQIAWWRRAAAAFQANGFQGDAFQPEAVFEWHVFSMALVDAGPS